MDIYHIVNRGVDKRDIVADDGDRIRFVRSLYVFNDSKPAPNPITQRNLRNKPERDRDLLVKIHSWCLMKNHYHLLLSPINNDLKKLSLFMKKLNMGYARFFNEKYDRSGYLWQGKYKKISIKRDSHFNYIPYYIHLNPLDYTHPEWRDGKVTSQNSVHEELTKYRWSSFLDYCGKNNFPSILHKKLMTDTLGDQHNQLKEIDNIIRTQALATPSNQIEI